MSIRYFASKNLKIFLKKIASRLFLPNSNPGGGPWNLPKIRSAIGLQIYVAVVKIVDHLSETIWAAVTTKNNVIVKRHM
jgi:hypothetical protein